MSTLFCNDKKVPLPEIISPMYRVYKHMRHLLIISAMLAFTSAFAQSGFVKTKGQQFTLNGKPYYYIGTNYWYGGLLAGVKGEAGKQRLNRELAEMQKQGITNVRVLIGAEGVSANDQQLPYIMQPKKGQYDQNLLASLDYFLAQLSKYQIKAILYFTNNWDWSGGMAQYLSWNGYGQPPVPGGVGYGATGGGNYYQDYTKYVSQFYTCDACMADLNQHIKFILNRKNTVSGLLYKNDPAVMAWELANEPRPMRSSSIDAYRKWIAATSAYIKTIDQNHLVTTGSEGTMGTEGRLDLFEQTHATPGIDYLTIHIWPKNWGWFKDTSITAGMEQIKKNTGDYIDKHIAVAQKLNKPLVIEEFGLPRDNHSFLLGSTTGARNTYYRFVFNYLEQSKQHNGPVAGVNFWGLGGYGKIDTQRHNWRKGDDFTSDPGQEEQGLNSVFFSDVSTWQVIRKAAQEAKR